MITTSPDRITVHFMRDELGAIASLAVCAASDGMTPIINAINVIGQADGRIVAISTDRYRAARFTMPCTPAVEFSVALPTKFVTEFYAAIKTDKTRQLVVQMVVEGSTVTLECFSAGITRQTQVVNGQYPAMGKLFPEWSDEPVTHTPMQLNANLLAGLAKLTLPEDAGLTPAKRNSVWRMQNTFHRDLEKHGPALFTASSKDRIFTMEFLIQPVVLPR
jgi:hypothetical protein